MATVVNVKIGRVSANSTDIYATWDFKKQVNEIATSGSKKGKKTGKKISAVQEYVVRWKYATDAGKKKWFPSPDVTTNGGETQMQKVIYSPPETAKWVSVEIKPVSKKYPKKN